MAAPNQDFITYIGDSVSPIFTVLSPLSTGVDISGVTDITWKAQRNATSTNAVIKTKSGGGISFVTNGTDGAFQVNILTSDTAALSGWYMHTAILTSTVGVMTATVGRMQVGPPPSWTWDPGSMPTTPLYVVRSLCGDTVQSDQQLSDEQIGWAISQYSNPWLAAAECCRMIAAYYSRMVDTVEGLLRTMYSSRRRSYMAMASDLEQRGFARGGVSAFVGGISLTDKQNNVANTDRVPPQFVLGMFDNLLPETPVGHQTGAGQELPVVDASATPSVAGGPV
jgi:hypothetical protein